jgi:catechol 2,3-dioxygenase-like lactoylglutathione lyase family enzyme
MQGPVPDQLNLVVTDMDAAVAFYRKLGLAIPGVHSLGALRCGAVGWIHWPPGGGDLVSFGCGAGALQELFQGAQVARDRCLDSWDG